MWREAGGLNETVIVPDLLLVSALATWLEETGKREAWGPS